MNQSYFYCANIPSKVRLSGATAVSVFNSKIKETVHNLNGPWGMPVSMGERPSQRDVFRCFLKVATEMAEWTDSERLFPRVGAQE